MSKKYIGITIGPILDTMLDASTPAGMWFSSFLFSDITRRICQKITGADEPLGKVEIYSPYFNETSQNGNGTTDIFEDGIGKYHDRILFSAEKESMDDCEKMLNALIDVVKRETAEYFRELFEDKELSNRYTLEDTETFFKEYLQIHYIISNDLQAGNIILDMSDKLSALELMKTFPKENTVNPIATILLGKEQGKNDLIKCSSLFSSIKRKDALMNKQKQIRSIEDIARTEHTDGLKVGKYFAVVNADGDRMGKTLEKLKNEDLESFSKALFAHASAAATAIHEFGGMTIYAGGDDLLFLAPLTGKNGKTIFSLCDTIRQQFITSMRESLADKLGDEAPPTLSFGISAQYYKYPLYEALELSRRFLQDSKAMPGKNATTFQLQKHSGQTVCLKIPNDNLEKVEALLSIGNADLNDEKLQKTEVLHSQIYSLEQFKALYHELIEQTMREHPEKEEEKRKERFLVLWTHLFDNSGQAPFQTYIKNIAGFFYDHCIGQKQYIAYMPGFEHGTETEKTVQTDELVFSFSTLLRLKKFYQEKEGDRE